MMESGWISCAAEKGWRLFRLWGIYRFRWRGHGQSSRIAYQSKDEKEFYARLDQMMDLAACPEH